MERKVTFTMEDLAPALKAAGIDPDSLTDYEWRKFEEAFVAGTHWDEVAGYAAEVVAALRGVKS
jgi:hypothetical protein